METKNELKVCELDGKETNTDGTIVIKSHWNRKRMLVVIRIMGHEYTVLADELMRAIENCKNTE